MEPQGIQIISKAGFKTNLICSLGAHFLQELQYVALSLIHHYIHKCISVSSRLYREGVLAIEFRYSYLHLIN